MSNFLDALQASAFSEWLALSMLGFPTLIALHSVGMAVVVGLSLIVTLQLFGLLNGFSDDLIDRFLMVAVWGFTLNLLTGLLLFVTRGSDYLSSLVFLIKMMLVLCSAAILFWLRLRLRADAGRGSSFSGDSVAKKMSLVATAAWFGAVVAGRLIAYLSDIYR